MRSRNIVSLVLRLVAAFIMLQTLYFKFTAQPESVYIFTQVGIEPWGRIATGVVELIASEMLLIPATVAIGELVALETMAGAIMSHVVILGIVVENDGGQLFIYALIVTLASIALLFIHREQVKALRARVFSSLVK